MTRTAVIIAGGRDLCGPAAYAMVEAAVEAWQTRSRLSVGFVVEGGQRRYASERHSPEGGIDWHAKVWASRHAVPCKTVPANWAKYGRRAGPIRNEEMVALPGVWGLIAVWDGRSAGTKDCILQALAAGLEVFVWFTDGRPVYHVPRFGQPPEVP